MLYSWACKLDTGYKFREEQNINLLLTSSTLKEDKEISKLLQVRTQIYRALQQMLQIVGNYHALLRLPYHLIRNGRY